jgi:hypothetical protein
MPVKLIAALAGATVMSMVLLLKALAPTDSWSVNRANVPAPAMAANAVKTTMVARSRCFVRVPVLLLIRHQSGNWRGNLRDF